MALTNTSKQISSLKINKIPSAEVYAKMVAQNLINDDELYLVQETEHTINKYTFTATARQSTFTIPFDFDDSSALTVFYNGVMMKEADNYTISGSTLTLVDFTAEANDYITVTGIEGMAAVDVDAKIGEIQTAVNNAKTEMDTKVSSAKTEIDTKVSDAIAVIDERIPSEISQIVYKNKTNTMASGSKITMDTDYVPMENMDVATKSYVDNAKPATFTSSTAGTVPASGGGTTKYLRADGTWNAIPTTPVVGTSTAYAIYIGSTAPASGTTPLLWIDTTSSTGTFKYRTSTTGTWTAVPVAWG